VLEGGEDGEFVFKGGSRRLDGSGVDASVYVLHDFLVGFWR
jgi:hypothetical protein